MKTGAISDDLTSVPCSVSCMLSCSVPVSYSIAPVCLVCSQISVEPQQCTAVCVIWSQNSVGATDSVCVIWSQVVSASVERGKFRVIMQYMEPHCIVEDGWRALEW